MNSAKPKTLIRKRKETSGNAKGAKKNGEMADFLLDAKILRRAAEERTRKKAADELLKQTLKNSSSPIEECVVQATNDLQKGSWIEMPQSLKDSSAGEAGYVTGDLHATRVLWLVRAFHEGDPTQRQQIAAALAASPLVLDAVSDLKSENREKTYVAFSLLFMLAKSGQLQPLLQALQTHPSIEVRLGLVKLMALSQHPDVVPALRVVASANSIDPEVRSAAQEVISQMPNLGGCTSIE